MWLRNGSKLAIEAAAKDAQLLASNQANLRGAVTEADYEPETPEGWQAFPRYALQLPIQDQQSGVVIQHSAHPSFFTPTALPF